MPDKRGPVYPPKVKPADGHHDLVIIANGTTNDLEFRTLVVLEFSLASIMNLAGLCDRVATAAHTVEGALLQEQLCWGEQWLAT